MQLEKQTPGYKQTEVGVIPADWELRPVGSKGEVRAGKALAVRGPGQLRPYLRTKNVFDGRIDIDDVLEMPMTDAEFALYRLRHGDVLLNEGQSIELVGRCAMYQDEFPQPCGIQNQLVRFRAFESTSARFAAHLFRRCQTSGIFSKIALQTTSVAHLGVSRFHQLRLAWPPTKTEQEAIAGALSDADGLIESLEKLIAKKRQIKHGTMQELLTGKRRLPGFSGKWETVRAGDIGRFRGGSGFPTKFQGRLSGDYPFFKVSDMNNEGNDTFMRSANNYVTEATRKIIGAVLFPEHSVVFAKVGAAVFLERKKILAQPSCLDNNMAAFILYADRADFRFVHFLMLNMRLGDLVSTTALPALSGYTLSEIEVTLPPQLNEQAAIAEVLSDMDAEIAALEAKLAKARQVKQGMMQELLTGKVRLV